MQYVREHWNYLTEKGIYPGVDVLRAIAVTMVIFYHFQFLYVGWVGVDLFFVISGFLIGGIIIDKVISDRFSFIDFYYRRALRILPVYYFAIIMVAILKGNGPLNWIAIKTIASGALFLHTTGSFFFPSKFMLDDSFIVGGSWSLVIEEMFYLFAPLAMVLILKASKKNMNLTAFVVLLVVLSGMVVRSYMTREFQYNDSNNFFSSFIQFHSRYDELAAGVLAAILVRSRKSIKSESFWWMSFSIVLMVLFFMYLVSNELFWMRPYLITTDTIWIPTIFAMCGMSLLLGMFWKTNPPFMVIFLARISYPLYLVHILFLEVVNPISGKGILLWLAEAFTIQGRAVVYILASIFLAYLVSLLVEYPFVRMYKKRAENITSKSKDSSSRLDDAAIK